MSERASATVFSDIRPKYPLSRSAATANRGEAALGASSETRKPHGPAGIAGGLTHDYLAFARAGAPNLSQTDRGEGVASLIR